MRNVNTARPSLVSFCLPTSQVLLALVNLVPDAGGGICKHPPTQAPCRRWETVCPHWQSDHSILQNNFSLRISGKGLG